jgi:two-component system chemotaxis response regulator CheY
MQFFLFWMGCDTDCCQENPMARVLITDESEAVRQIGSRILRELGFEVSEASGVLDALVRCEAALPDAVIVDSAMHGALELIANIRTMPRGETVRILYSVIEADLRKLMTAKRAGADDFLLKPFDSKVLGAHFANAASAA